MLIFSKNFFKSMHTRLEKSDRIMRYSRYLLDPPLDNRTEFETVGSNLRLWNII